MVLMQLHLEDLRHYYNFDQYFMDNIPHVDEYDLQYHKKTSRVCRIGGFTLYWDYYSYMISRGFFNDRDVKTSDKKYIKVG